MELVIGLCEQLDVACIARVNADYAFDIIHNLIGSEGFFAT